MPIQRLITLGCCLLAANISFAGYTSSNGNSSSTGYNSGSTTTQSNGYGNGGYTTTNGGGATTTTTTTRDRGYNSVDTSQSSGYYSTNQSGARWHHQYRNHNSSVSINVNMPTFSGYVPANPIYYRDWNENIPGLRWITLSAYEHIPAFAVIGGGQPGYTFFVCRGRYRGGVHPGKLIAGKCNIGWGGREVELSNYDVLVAKRELGWVSDSNGNVPQNAIPGGYDSNGPLYVCQADYRGGRHAGKVIGNACNIGWGHREISVPYYSVLVG